VLRASDGEVQGKKVFLAKVTFYFSYLSNFFHHYFFYFYSSKSGSECCILCYIAVCSFEYFSTSICDSFLYVLSETKMFVRNILESTFTFT